MRLLSSLLALACGGHGLAAAIPPSSASLTSQPEVPVAVAPPPGGEAVVSVLACGAIPNDGQDDSAAFERALAQVRAAGRGVLYVPPGDYQFARQVSIELKGVALTLRGDGQGVSRLWSQNRDGILDLYDDTCTWQVAVRDLSFLAGQPEAGTALALRSGHRGARNYRSVTLRDVDVRGGPVLPATHYFTRGVAAIGQWRPLFENVIVCGAAGPKISSLREDGDIVYGMTVGMQADWCYAPTFENCYAWSTHTGYQIVNEGRPEGPEDGSFRRCTANSVRIGIDIKTPIKEPQLVIDACHINARDVGIRLEKRKFFHLTNNLLYGLDTARTDQPYVDILLLDCYDGYIAGNIFHSPAVHNLKPEPEVNRVMIRADQGTRDIIITNNLFNAKGRAIVVEPGASNVMARDNHSSNAQSRLQ